MDGSSLPTLMVLRTYLSIPCFSSWTTNIWIKLPFDFRLWADLIVQIEFKLPDIVAWRITGFTPPTNYTSIGVTVGWDCSGSGHYPAALCWYFRRHYKINWSHLASARFTIVGSMPRWCTMPVHNNCSQMSHQHAWSHLGMHLRLRGILPPMLAIISPTELGTQVYHLCITLECDITYSCQTPN